MQVEIFEMEDAGFYVDANTCGSAVKVTLRRGEDYATCDSVLIMEEDADSLQAAFDEWVDCAMAGEAGYSAVVVEGDKTVLYGA